MKQREAFLGLFKTAGQIFLAITACDCPFCHQRRSSWFGPSCCEADEMMNKIARGHRPTEDDLQVFNHARMKYGVRRPK